VGLKKAGFKVIYSFTINCTKTRLIKIKNLYNDEDHTCKGFLERKEIFKPTPYLAPVA